MQEPKKNPIPKLNPKNPDWLKNKLFEQRKASIKQVQFHGPGHRG